MATKHKMVTTDNEINAAIKAARQFEAKDRRVTRARYDAKGDRVSLELTDGLHVSIPRTYLQGLEKASQPELSKIEILGRGTGLRWPKLEVDHYVLGLLNRVFGTAQWMAHVGRLGGRSRSAAKAVAARANGRRGGRPKKGVRGAGTSHITQTHKSANRNKTA